MSNPNVELFRQLQKEGRDPARLPWAGREVPHVVIDINQNCNISCDACYKNKHTQEKPLVQVQEEIDLALTQRNFIDITISGGEPTLHSQLPEILAYAAKKGLRSMILTNGFRFDLDVLKRLKAAGLTEILLHIDTHQHRSDLPNVNLESDLNPDRHHYVEMCRQAGLSVSFVLTLYRDTLDDLASVLAFSQSEPSPARGMLVTCYAESVNYDRSLLERDSGLQLLTSDVVRYLRERENAYPVFYVASSHNVEDMRWLVYIAAVSTDRDQQLTKLYVDPRHKLMFALFFRAQRWLLGRYYFAETSMKTRQVVTYLLTYAVLSLSPRTSFRVLRLLAKALRNGNLRLSPAVFQQAPNRLSSGEYETCQDCPDSTVRDGRLVPVCLADIAAPEELGGTYGHVTR
ncbi:MAG: hypothetical protein A2289_18500 [Deltaproteobacteria bacterium RIFOXYA12_FULL_58_15]|nr:MAG: hypothetical protein A2289_18500 [Deltaproteobacteria bacterium RIFOXYA12_FULL_58_15]OGR10600.1 MAG: hypothetical protein A2341_09630 [Deltaproteobacteria bacterium RIFOXYB12_FULL_58_9]